MCRPKHGWDDVAEMEKQCETYAVTENTVALMQTLINTIPKPSTDASILKKTKKSAITLYDSMVLAIYVYALAGKEMEAVTEDVELLLMNQWLKVAIQTRGQSLPPELQPEAMQDSNASEDTSRLYLRQWQMMLEDWMTRCIEQLRKVALMRAGLKHYSQLYAMDATLAYTPLLARIMEECYGAEMTERALATDLDHVSATGTLGSLVSGFSRFLRAAQPHPSRHSHVMVVVVGGVTFAEVKAVQHVLHNSAIDGLIVSNGMATATRVAHHLFLNTS